MGEPEKVVIDRSITAAEILGNPTYRAISYGGYRQKSRDIQPSVEELKEDMRILHAAGIRVLRTYNTHFAHASNVLKAISELNAADDSFEMYVMLGAWIDCKDAWTDHPNHDDENEEANQAEIDRAVSLANQYPDIVKIIAVGNEAMVKWAASYFVQPWVILKYVKQLQQLKTNGNLSKDIWITSSDNFASWGGGEDQYHVPDLDSLITLVDFISLHTYPMHDTHYNPDFWGAIDAKPEMSKEEKIQLIMEGARDYAMNQFMSVKEYVSDIAPDKPLHIGETGWASSSNGFYGDGGSKATDEYKEALYHDLMRAWTDQENISCFYFEAFDEIWKDAANPGGSENHFGLFTIDGKAKYVYWNLVDQDIFEGLSRGGHAITKTFNGQKDSLLRSVNLPPIMQKETVK